MPTDRDYRVATMFAALGLYLPLLGLIPAVAFTVLAIRRSGGAIGWPVLWVNLAVVAAFTLVGLGQWAQRNPLPW